MVAPPSPVAPSGPVLASRPLVAVAFAVLAGLVLILGAGLSGSANGSGPAAPAQLVPIALAVALVQLATLVVVVVTRRPPAWRAVAVVAGAAAISADVVACLRAADGLSPLAVVLALAVVAALVAQLTRGVVRADVTDSIGWTLALSALVVGSATAIVLVAARPGSAGLVPVAVGASVAIAVTRFVDLVTVRPRLRPGLARGGVGLVVGVAFGLAAAGAFTELTRSLRVAAGVFIGVAAVVAVLADLGACYGTEGTPAPSPVRGHGDRDQSVGLAIGAGLGPLVGLAVAMPVGYVLAMLALG